MKTHSHQADHSMFLTTWFEKVASRITRVIQSLRLYWQRAEQRRALQQVSYRELQDMGFSRADALEETRKPFWKA